MPQERLYKTDAIVLRRRDFSEADRMLTVFTPKRGKIQLLAKGVKKLKSKKAGHVELFMHSHFLVAVGRSFGMITQAEVLQPYQDLREDLDKVSRAYYVSELVDKFTEEDDPNYPIFELLAITLARLADGNDDQQFKALRVFELRLLSYTGYQPQLFFCLNCNRPIQAVTNFFSAPDGGVFCPDCGPGQRQAAPVNPGVLKMLRFWQTHSWDEAIAVQLKPATKQTVEQLLNRYLIAILEKNLKSVSFLKQVTRPAGK